MNVILLSGGSGKRLWPLSNDVRSKQFIKLFKNNDEYDYGAACLSPDHHGRRRCQDYHCDQQISSKCYQESAG